MFDKKRGVEVCDLDGNEAYGHAQIGESEHLCSECYKNGGNQWKNYILIVRLQRRIEALEERLGPSEVAKSKTVKLDPVNVAPKPVTVGKS